MEETVTQEIVWRLFSFLFGGANGCRTTADEITKEVEFGSTRKAGLFDFNFGNDWRMEWEDFFHSNLIRSDLADGKSGIVVGFDRENYAFKNLDAGFVAFFDCLMDTDGVTDMERNIIVCSLICHITVF